MVSDAGIALVYVNRQPVDFEKLPAGTAVVASDEKLSGTLQARQVCKLLEGRGNILVLMGELSNESARTRTRDIEEVAATRSEEHTSELQSPCNLVCRLLLEKKK